MRTALGQSMAALIERSWAQNPEGKTPPPAPLLLVCVPTSSEPPEAAPSALLNPASACVLDPAERPRFEEARQILKQGACLL